MSYPHWNIRIRERDEPLRRFIERKAAEEGIDESAVIRRLIRKGAIQEGAASGSVSENQAKGEDD